MTRARVLAGLPFAALLALAMHVRLTGTHAALLYPDGYQYLLMARGIAEHLQPTTMLGPGGDAFVPNPDAALKPLFPILVAGTHAVGLSWLEAARVVTSVAGAVAVTALALLVARIGRSTIAGLGAGLLLLTSPTASFWSGFSGPDPLAQALVLTAALAFVVRRPRLGGILTALAIAARPEVAVLALAAALVTATRKPYRGDLVRAATTTIVATALLFASVRTPLAFPEWRLVALALLLVPAVTVAALVLPATRRLRVGVALSAVLVLLAVLREPGPGELARAEWPLLVLAGVALVALLVDGRRAPATAFTMVGVLALGGVYLLKNPSLTRYFSLVLPAAALLAGLAVTSVPRRLRPVTLAAVALVALAGVDRSFPGSRDYDVFAEVASRVAPKLDGAPLVTAAPDAYGFWLPAHPVQRMRPGARGAVMLDAAQRLYEPRLTARGVVTARVTEEIAFARPDGEIDAGPAVVVAGTVVTRRAGSHELRQVAAHGTAPG